MNEIADTTTEDVVIGSLISYPDEYNAVAPYIPETQVFTQKKSQALWKKISKMIRKG